MNAASFDPQSVAGLSMRDLIDRNADEHPDSIFLIDSHEGTTVTFKQMQTTARNVASSIAALEVKPGDSVAFALHNGLPCVSIILGTLYGGFLATAVNLVSGSNTISHVLEHSNARLIVVQDDTEPLVEHVAGDSITTVLAIELLNRENTWDGGNPVNDETDGLLMYTSGTTGVPKGVTLTHGSLIAGGANTVLAHKLTQNDRGLCVLPLYHINAFCVSLLGALVSGGSLILPQRFSVSRFWNQLRDHHGTWFSVVPTQISYLLQEAGTNDVESSGLEQLRFGRSASAPLSPDVQKAFEDRFNVPIIETMGLTETAAQILSNPLDGRRKTGSPGIAFGNEVLIANEQQEECTRGVEGEVIVRGSNVMRCYRNNSTATKASLTRDGWLRTGDLGVMDEDGYVFITGRLKELIIKGGENIAPREIDDALYSHPDVIEAAAFARSCTIYGQKVEAGVALRNGSLLTESALIDLCTQRVGKFKAPDHVHFLNELPKGPSGKIQRLKIAEMTA